MVRERAWVLARYKILSARSKTKQRNISVKAEGIGEHEVDIFVGDGNSWWNTSYCFSSSRFDMLIIVWTPFRFIILIACLYASLFWFPCAWILFLVFFLFVIIVDFGLKHFVHFWLLLVLVYGFFCNISYNHQKEWCQQANCIWINYLTVLLFNLVYFYFLLSSSFDVSFLFKFCFSSSIRFRFDFCHFFVLVCMLLICITAYITYTIIIHVLIFEYTSPNRK